MATLRQTLLDTATASSPGRGVPPFLPHPPPGPSSAENFQLKVPSTLCPVPATACTLRGQATGASSLVPAAGKRKNKRPKESPAQLIALARTRAERVAERRQRTSKVQSLSLLQSNSVTPLVQERYTGLWHMLLIFIAVNQLFRATAIEMDLTLTVYFDFVFLEGEAL